MSIDVRLVSSDDWQALYVDGRKVAENHTVTLRDALEALEGVHVGQAFRHEVSEEWAEHHGFPENFSEFPEGILD